jgi:hypothetical protein
LRALSETLGHSKLFYLELYRHAANSFGLPEAASAVKEGCNLGRSYAELWIVTECGLRSYSVAKTNPDDVKRGDYSLPNPTTNYCFPIHTDVFFAAVA